MPGPTQFECWRYELNTCNRLLKNIQPFLDAATGFEAYTTGLVTLVPESGFGKAPPRLLGNPDRPSPDRRGGHRGRHPAPLRRDRSTIHSAKQSQGGDAGRTGSFAVDFSENTGRGHGDVDAREGDRARTLGLPIRDAIVSPVHTVHPDVTIETAVE